MLVHILSPTTFLLTSQNHTVSYANWVDVVQTSDIPGMNILPRQQVDEDNDFILRRLLEVNLMVSKTLSE